MKYFIIPSLPSPTHTTTKTGEYELWLNYGRSRAHSFSFNLISIKPKILFLKKRKI